MADENQARKSPERQPAPRQQQPKRSGPSSQSRASQSGDAMPSKGEMKRLMQEFPTPQTALLAASWGENATKNWMESGADPSKIPEKDKQFVSEMLPKMKQGSDAPVESRRVVQGADGGPSAEEAKMARIKAREEMMAGAVSQGAKDRSAAREAARGQLRQMRGERARQQTQTPEVRRNAPDQGRA